MWSIHPVAVAYTVCMRPRLAASRDLGRLAVMIARSGAGG